MAATSPGHGGEEPERQEPLRGQQEAAAAVDPHGEAAGHLRASPAEEEDGEEEHDGDEDGEGSQAEHAGGRDHDEHRRQEHRADEDGGGGDEDEAEEEEDHGEHHPRIEIEEGDEGHHPHEEHDDSQEFPQRARDARPDDARSDGSFVSMDNEEGADDEDDFDPPQDTQAGHSSSSAAPAAYEERGTEGIEQWNLRKDGNKELLEPIWLRLSQEEREHVKISKMFSYVLRHAAHKLDVRIRKDGFVRLREIMKLRNFKPYSLEELMAVVYFDEKERYTMVRESDGELLIRANQGHTMKVVDDSMLLEVITDASTVPDCVHGTYLVHWPFIRKQGLSKVARNHIHLASGLPEDGKIRGMRSTAELFVYVDVARAMEDGVVFFRSKNEVILTTGFDGWLPPKYFSKAVRIDYNTCDIEEMEFDRGVEMPTWAAELAPSGPGEQGTYLIKNLEALISNCKKRLSEMMELKALQEAGTELTDEESHKLTFYQQVYTELQSLEQRFRQHKGHRKESTQEKELRMKEEAEAGTLVKRMDRAVTPPWERGKPSMESAAMKSTEKEKAEWAALGRRRDNAPPATPKKDDPWTALGRGRTPTAAAASTPSAFGRGRGAGGKGQGRDDDDDAEWAALARRRENAPQATPKWDDAKKGGGGGPGAGPGPGPERKKERFGFDRADSQKLGREDSWRFKGDDSQAIGRTDSQRMTREDSKQQPTPSGGAAGGPPRFFNSKKSTDVPSWRDRLSGTGSASKDLDEPSWRDAPSQQYSEAPKLLRHATAPAAPAAPQAPAHPSPATPSAAGATMLLRGHSMGAAQADGSAGQYAAAGVPMWGQGSQMCGYGGGPQQQAAAGMGYMAPGGQQQAQPPTTPSAGGVQVPVKGHGMGAAQADGNAAQYMAAMWQANQMCNYGAQGSMGGYMASAGQQAPAHQPPASASTGAGSLRGSAGMGAAQLDSGAGQYMEGMSSMWQANQMCSYGQQGQGNMGYMAHGGQQASAHQGPTTPSAGAAPMMWGQGNQMCGSQGNHMCGYGSPQGGMCYAASGGQQDDQWAAAPAGCGRGCGGGGAAAAGGRGHDDERADWAAGGRRRDNAPGGQPPATPSAAAMPQRGHGAGAGQADGGGGQYNMGAAASMWGQGNQMCGYGSPQGSQMCYMGPGGQQAGAHQPPTTASSAGLPLKGHGADADGGAGGYMPMWGQGSQMCGYGAQQGGMCYMPPGGQQQGSHAPQGGSVPGHAQPQTPMGYSAASAEQQDWAALGRARAAARTSGP